MQPFRPIFTVSQPHARYLCPVRSTVESSSPPQSDAAGRATVFPGVSGMPWWGAVLLALGLTAIGGVIDRITGTIPFDSTSFPGLGLQIGFYAGALLAALLVRRRALFTAAVQPPLVLIICVVALLRFAWSQSLTSSAVAVVSVFPTMAIGTGVVVVVAVVRLLSQPLKKASAGSGAPVSR